MLIFIPRPHPPQIVPGKLRQQRKAARVSGVGPDQLEELGGLQAAVAAAAAAAAAGAAAVSSGAGAPLAQGRERRDADHMSGAAGQLRPGAVGQQRGQQQRLQQQHGHHLGQQPLGQQQLGGRPYSPPELSRAPPNGGFAARAARDSVFYTLPLNTPVPVLHIEMELVGDPHGGRPELHLRSSEWSELAARCPSMVGLQHATSRFVQDLESQARCRWATLGAWQQLMHPSFPPNLGAVFSFHLSRSFAPVTVTMHGHAAGQIWLGRWLGVGRGRMMVCN